MLSVYRLPNQLPGEEVLYIIRRDLFILFKRVLFFILLIILPLVFFYLLLITKSVFILGDVSHALVVLGTSAYYLFIWLFFFFSFIDYYLDVWIITNERIIDIQQRGFFSRVIAEQKLFRIQDVTSEVNGLIPTMFRYGDCHIQTAGAKQRFLFHEVPNPDKIRDNIIKLAEMNKIKHPEAFKAEKME